MWSSRTTRHGTRCIEHEVLAGPHPVGFAEALHLLATETRFRGFLNRLLRECPFRAFRWETPGVAQDTAERPFTFVVLDAPGLAQAAPAEDAFAAQFAAAGRELAVAFPNLGRDATLVAPCPLGEPAVYPHLGAFVRRGPEAQRDALWQCVGTAALDRLGPAPFWLNTAGAGVAWLHVRLDDRPKYYGHRPYWSAAWAGADPERIRIVGQHWIQPGPTRFAVFEIEVEPRTPADMAGFRIAPGSADVTLVQPTILASDHSWQPLPLRLQPAPDSLEAEAFWCTPRRIVFAATDARAGEVLASTLGPCTVPAATPLPERLRGFFENIRDEHFFGDPETAEDA